MGRESVEYRQGRVDRSAGNSLPKGLKVALGAASVIVVMSVVGLWIVGNGWAVDDKQDAIPADAVGLLGWIAVLVSGWMLPVMLAGEVRDLEARSARTSWFLLLDALAYSLVVALGTLVWRFVADFSSSATVEDFWDGNSVTVFASAWLVAWTMCAFAMAGMRTTFLMRPLPVAVGLCLWLVAPVVYAWVMVFAHLDEPADGGLRLPLLGAIALVATAIGVVSEMLGSPGAGGRRLAGPVQ